MFLCMTYNLQKLGSKLNINYFGLTHPLLLSQDILESETEPLKGLNQLDKKLRVLDVECWSCRVLDVIKVYLMYLLYHSASLN